MAEHFSADVEFYIAAGDIPVAAAGLRAAALARRGGDPEWADEILRLPETLEPREVLQRIFEFSGWSPSFDASGNIVEVDIADDYDATGFHTDLLFLALGPYVREGSHVQLLSDEGADVVYHFRGGRCVIASTLDPLDHRDRALVGPDVRADLQRRIHGFLEAIGEEGRALAAELKDEIDGE